MNHAYKLTVLDEIDSLCIAKPVRKRSAETGKLVGVRLQEDQLKAIDARAAKQVPPVTRPEAIRGMIDAMLREIVQQPIGPQPGLRAEVDRLVKSEDVSALVSLYDSYVAVAMAFQSLGNQPRSSETREFLAEESAHAWSKAYYVADHLKTIRPYDDLERYAAALFDCTIAMGGNLAEAVAVVNEINSWPQIERPAA